MTLIAPCLDENSPQDGNSPQSLNTRNLYFDDVGITVPMAKRMYAQAKGLLIPSPRVDNKDKKPEYRSRINFFSSSPSKIENSNKREGSVADSPRNLYFEDLFGFGSYSLSRFFFKNKYEVKGGSGKSSVTSVKENEHEDEDGSMIFCAVDGEKDLQAIARQSQHNNENVPNRQPPIRIRASGQIMESNSSVQLLPDDSNTGGDKDDTTTTTAVDELSVSGNLAVKRDQCRTEEAAAAPLGGNGKRSRTTSRAPSCQNLVNSRSPSQSSMMVPPPGSTSRGASFKNRPQGAMSTTSEPNSIRSAGTPSQHSLENDSDNLVNVLSASLSSGLRGTVDADGSSSPSTGQRILLPSIGKSRPSSAGDNSRRSSKRNLLVKETDSSVP